MGMVEVSITEAAINESIDVLAAYNSVTNVRLYREIVLGFTLDVDRIALAPSCGCTDGPVLVDVVADFREDLVSCDCISITALRSKSGKTKCIGPIKRNVIFSSKTKCNKIKNAHSTKEVDLKPIIKSTSFSIH